MERDPARIARMIAESIRSPLRGFVYDKRLIDDGVVRELVRASGASRLLARWSKGDIVVYMVNYRSIESLCRYEECRSNGPEAWTCIQECVAKKISEVSDSIALSILDAVASLSSGK